MGKFLLRRIQSSNLREVLSAAGPTYIDHFLYISEESSRECPHRLSFPVSIKAFSVKHLSGVDGIDQRLTPHRLAYIVFYFGQIIHQSWVYLDAVMPAQFKFDSRVPLIGDSYTDAMYRGHGIFPYALNYILKDLKDRQISDKAYMLVSPANDASIRGVEKAGFELLAHLRGTRLLGFIMNKSIQRVPEAA